MDTLICFETQYNIIPENVSDSLGTPCTLVMLHDIFKSADILHFECLRSTLSYGLKYPFLGSLKPKKSVLRKCVYVCISVASSNV